MNNTAINEDNEDLSTDDEISGEVFYSPYGDGVFVLKTDGGREGLYQRRQCKEDYSYDFISKPVIVLAVVRDTQNTGYGKLIEFVDMDGNRREAIIRFSDIGRDCETIIKGLRDEGLFITTNNGVAKRLVDYIHNCPPPNNRRIRFSNKTGWQGGCFLLPNECIGTSDEEFVFSSASSKTVSFEANGTLEDWTNNLASNCTQNPILAFSVNTAFAAPLLHLLEMENGGFHLVGDSSIGKSTALLAAASVFGDPSKGVPKWNATINAMEGTAKAHNDILLPLDEIGQSSPSHIGESIYMLGNGLGKGRSTVTGEARQRVQFRTLFLSNGEKTLECHMREAGKSTMAGMEVRLVNIPADCGEYGIYSDILGHDDSNTFNEIVRDAANTCYGTAFPAFVKKVVANRETVIKFTKKIIEKFVERNVEANADGQVKRVAKRFGLVEAAGTLATRWRITGWEIHEARNAAEFCFRKWLEQRGGNERTEEIRLLNQVRAFFEAHGSSRFTDCTITGHHDKVTINRVGFKKKTPDGVTYYIVFPEQFKKEICQGYDPKTAANILYKNRILDKGSDGKFAKPCNIPGEQKKKRMYIFTDRVYADYEPSINPGNSGNKVPV
jgi:putative DNA primase/helicase